MVPGLERDELIQHGIEDEVYFYLDKNYIISDKASHYEPFKFRPRMLSGSWGHCFTQALVIQNSLLILVHDYYNNLKAILIENATQ